jgi:FkbM family methyltransferase
MNVDLENVKFVAFPDWNRAEEDVCNDLRVMMHRLCLLEENNPISLLLSTDNLEDLEHGNFILAAAGMELMTTENIDINDYFDVLLLDRLSPMQWSELLPQLQGKISLSLEDTSAIDLARANTLDRFDLVDYLTLAKKSTQHNIPALKLNIELTSLKNIADYAALEKIEIFAHSTFFEIFKTDKILRISTDNTVYLKDMIDHFDYYFNAVLPIEIDGRSIVDYSTPRYHKLRGFDEIPYLFPSLSEPYITTEQYLEFADLKSGGIVLDMGAYAGITSIIFGRIVSHEGKVYAFEPDPQNYACIHENIKIARAAGGLENIKVIEKAVWENSLGLEFSSEGAMGSSATEIVGLARGNILKVPSISIADFCEINDIQKLDFIKMDIEGGEVKVLESAKEILAKLRPKMIIEPHYIDNQLSTTACRQILESIGYTVKLIEQYGVALPLIEATPNN